MAKIKQTDTTGNVEVNVESTTATTGEPNSNLENGDKKLKEGGNNDESNPNKQVSQDKLVEGIDSLELDPGPADLYKRIVIKPVKIKPDENQSVPIVLVAGNNCDIRPTEGRYAIEDQFLRPAKINKWAIVLMVDKLVAEGFSVGNYSYEHLECFADRYNRVGRSKGVDISRLSGIHRFPSESTAEKNIETMPSDALKQELRQLFVKLAGQLVAHAIIILPGNSPPWIHGYLQYLETRVWESCEKEPGDKRLIRTSRIRYESFLSMVVRPRGYGRGSIIPTVWHKYNTKLGGVNVAFKKRFETHDMKFLNEGHLIVAIDCHYTHHDMRAGLPQISVAVGMWDLASSRMSFNTQTRAQPWAADEPSRTPIANLNQMIKQILSSYKERKDNKPPSNVIILSVGPYCESYDTVAQKEIAMIKQALDDEAPGGNAGAPVLTYLTVPISTNKRRREKSDELGQSNIFKLYDEDDLSPETIHKMVYALGYLSAKRTSFGCPFPVELAILALKRTQNIVRAWMDDHQVKRDDNQFIEKLNKFLAIEMGDKEYKNYLYYA